MDFWQVDWQIGTRHNAFCNTRERERHSGQMKVGAGEVFDKNGGITHAVGNNSGMACHNREPILVPQSGSLPKTHRSLVLAC
jgi:hypothetical protein